MGEGTPATAEPLLSVSELSVHFSRGRRKAPVRAVDGVSLAVAGSETVGVVGESGSGKTTLGRAILGLTPITGGSVRWDGEDITRATPRRRRELSSELQVIFQDPYSSLNPTRTVGQTIGEMLHLQKQLSRQEIDDRVATLLERVDLPRDAAARYPASFSGGQRQRVAIARALIVQPRLVICDEPVTALDLSVQAQVLKLLRELQQSLSLSYLFIAHDLDVVRYISDRVIVFYRGRLVEEGPAEVVYTSPIHPYTRALLEAAPIPDPTVKRPRRNETLDTGTDDGSRPPQAACQFAPRCPYRTEDCWTEQPELEPCGEARRVACHNWQVIDSSPLVEAVDGSIGAGGG